MRQTKAARLAKAAYKTRNMNVVSNLPNTLLRSPFLRYGALIALAALAAAVLIPGGIPNLLSSSGFMPHATCYLRNPKIIALHVTADGVIGVSYVCISLALGYLVYKASRDIPFHWMFLAFGLFIISCGMTHFMEIWTVWQSVYWLAGYVKFITAAASAVTAIALFSLVPKIFTLIDSVKLSEERHHNLVRAHAELEGAYRKVKVSDEVAAEAVERKKQLEKSLLAQQQAEERLQALTAELEERVAERTARLRDANEDLEMFTSTVAHDLRAPLRALHGLTQILKEDYAAHLDTTAQNYADRIIDSAKRMDALVMDLLTYTRISRGPLDAHPLEVRPLIAETQAALANEVQEHQAEITVEGEAPRVIANRTFLQQALANLITNAIKFVTPGTKPRVRILLEEQARDVRIWVEDNGIGIAPENHQRIFRVFERLHGSYPGTGIGLAIVQRAVNRMGGRTGVESTPGQGSRFWIELPKA